MNGLKRQMWNECVGYDEEKIIVRNDWGKLFYVPCPDENISKQMIGSTIPLEDLSTIEDLDEKEQAIIRALFGGKDDEL